ncbi:uncharacterized protein LOC111264747 isoform X2 [Varroa jacobsoni]|uniref:uncharacterized protein LOC111264747 isoform X2 n=1 Tax=Varroa jacobsoni TaxID=62625 RepID=UPI000BF8573A|nr:uncharacterized protein LOC111264747 isoform X2 [Varroa jacobsoni]
MDLKALFVCFTGIVLICPLVVLLCLLFTRAKECRRIRQRRVTSLASQSQENVVYHAPIPYMYGYGAQNEGGHHSHREVSDGLRARGSFTQTLSDGRTRTIEYIADEKGFRVLAMRDVYHDPNAIPSPKPTVKPIKDEAIPRWNPVRRKPREGAQNSV